MNENSNHDYYKFSSIFGLVSALFIESLGTYYVLWTYSNDYSREE